MSSIAELRSRGKGHSNDNGKPAADAQELDMRVPPGRKGHRKPGKRTRNCVEQHRPKDRYPLSGNAAEADEVDQEEPVRKSLLQTAKEARKQKAMSKPKGKTKAKSAKPARAGTDDGQVASKAKLKADPKTKAKGKGKAKRKSTKLARAEAGDGEAASSAKTEAKAKKANPKTKKAKTKKEPREEYPDAPNDDADWDEALDKFGEEPAARTCAEDTKQLREERAFVSKMLSDSAQEGGGPRLYGPLVAITNNLGEAYMLAQVLYFFEDSRRNGRIRARIFTRDGRRWLAKFASDWVDELWLPRRQVYRLRDGLKGLGLIETHRSKFKGRPCTFVRPNYGRIAEAILKATRDRNKKENP